MHSPKALRGMPLDALDAAEDAMLHDPSKCFTSPLPHAYKAAVIIGRRRRKALHSALEWNVGHAIPTAYEMYLRWMEDTHA